MKDIRGGASTGRQPAQLALLFYRDAEATESGAEAGARTQGSESERTDGHARPAAGAYRLLFRLQLHRHGWSLHPTARFVTPDGTVGAEAPGALAPNLDRARKKSREANALGFMQQGVKAGRRGFRRRYSFDDRAEAGYVFRQLRDADIYMHSSFRSRLQRHPTPVRFRLNVLVEGENAYALHLTLADPRGDEIPIDGSSRILTVDGESAFVYVDRVLYEASDCPPPSILDLFLKGEIPSGLPFGAVMKWLERLPPGLADGVARDLSGAVEPQLIRTFKGCRLHLSETGNRLDARCSFVYERDLEVPALPEARTKLISKGGVLYRVERDAEREKPFVKALKKAGLRPIGDVLRLDADVDPIRFVLYGVPDLEEQGVVVTEELTRYKVRRSKPKLSVAVQSGIDWFDLNVVLDYDGIRLNLQEILEAVRENADYVTLRDGSIARFDRSIRDALGFLSAAGRQGPRDGTLRLGRAQLLATEDVVRLADERRTDEAFDATLARLCSFDGIERTPPAAGFAAELRTYQQAGLDWLNFLRTYGFGGILADDMGLGKTVQTLALLHLQRHGESRRGGPYLVVAPTSIVYNWQREVERFTPDLTTLNYTGPDRPRNLRELRKHDVVFTSYAILRRDAGILAQIDFDTVVLDESQHIKNPDSQTFKAAVSLAARHRLCLTGTPVENSTVELWAQMHFANPGGLGSLNGFKDRFVTPIEKYGDRTAAERLRRLTSPFILRRRKEEVASDLPPKIEQVVYCEMDDTQRSVYEKWRDYYRANVLDHIQAEGLDKSRMKVLEGLMKLRQISNHPRLVEANYTGASGKFELLMETLEELRDEGHKVLVFSQFVKMLDVIRAALDGDGVPYAYLDGSTRDRQAVVDAFQQDPTVSCFLISLRAGGVGLNLTAADYVMLVDPWWNPAVEMQAIDRTHRIGQSKAVFAQKLITRGTVEEKILELQARKKQLAEDVVAVDDGMLKHLSLEDVEAFFGVRT
ncbi:MAG: DEAD/DEAH box helicase [Rhodothermales bacterium]